MDYLNHKLREKALAQRAMEVNRKHTADQQKLEHERQKENTRFIQTREANAIKERALALQEKYHQEVTEQKDRHHREKIELKEKLESIKAYSAIEVEQIKTQKENYLAELKHQQEKEIKAIDFKYQSALKKIDIEFHFEQDFRNNTHEEKIKRLEFEHKEKIEAIRRDLEKTKQARKIEHEQQLKVNEYIHEENMLTKKIEHESRIKKSEQRQQLAVIDRESEQERQTMSHKTDLEIKAYQEKTRSDMEKRAGEAMAYEYERMADAKWKVWVMEQELRIFGRKATESEINEFVRNNRDIWEKEIKKDE